MHFLENSFHLHSLVGAARYHTAMSTFLRNCQKNFFCTFVTVWDMTHCLATGFLAIKALSLWTCEVLAHSGGKMMFNSTSGVLRWTFMSAQSKIYDQATLWLEITCKNMSRSLGHFPATRVAMSRGHLLSKSCSCLLHILHCLTLVSDVFSSVLGSGISIIPTSDLCFHLISWVAFTFHPLSSSNS